MKTIDRERPAGGLPLMLAASFMLAVPLAGCGSGGAFHGVAEVAGFATTPQKSADFVEQSRAPSLDYKPVGVKPPDRGHSPMTTEELDALKAGLDRRRAGNEADAATARALGSTPMAQPPVVPPLE